MFKSGPNYSKLTTNIRLALNRLKLLEKKKYELAQKSRKEISDYISINKIERARIRVEHIIREDFIVEAMEVIEMYCDLLLARMGLIQHKKEVDEGLAEAISSIIWVTPHMQTDVAELKVISDQFGLKYGREYITACQSNTLGTVSSKLIHKLSVQAPPKLLVEKYLIEIAKNYNVYYEPDPSVMSAEPGPDGYLINFNDLNRNSGPGGPHTSGSGGGGQGVPSVAQFNLEFANLNRPVPPIGFVPPGFMPTVPADDNVQVDEAYSGVDSQIPPMVGAGVTAGGAGASDKPTPAKPPRVAPRNMPDFNLPEIPPVGPPPSSSDVNFDDLSKRFEALKKQNK